VERQSVARMAAEFFRELGVLIIVFYPIEAHFSGDLTALKYVAVVVAGMTLWGIGVMIERRRKE
jgi:hypothetical protein